MNKREQRLRRKARAQVRAAELAGAEQLKKLAGLRVIAHSAMVYVGAIDAPNPHEPWDVAKKRDALVDLVHAVQGRPGKGGQDFQVKRPEVAAVEGVVLPLHTLPPAPQRTVRAPERARVVVERSRSEFDLEVKRRELHNAAKKLGAEANKRIINHARVAELEQEHEAASVAYAVARAASVAGRRTA
jgi:hypothetical protein